MNLFDVILKLIDQLGLSTTEDTKKLYNDTKAWELECTEDSEDKLKSFYAKAHKGVFLRLAMPFLYFYLLSWVRNIGKSDDDFLND